MPKHVRALLTFVGWLLSWASASGQCPQAGFTLPDTVCINETFSITNTSTGATRYEWDFCSGDLAGTPSLTTVGSLPDAWVPVDVAPVFDGANWLAFVSSRNNSTIIRLNFGNSLDNTPVSVNLGNVSNMLSRPEQMELRKEGANWYGLVVNLNSSTLVRLNFGNSLLNTPTATPVTQLHGILSGCRGLDLVEENGQVYALIANSTNNRLTIVNFGSSVTNAPAPTDILNTDPLPGATSGLMGISVVRHCNTWVGLAVGSSSNKVYKLNFGSNIFSAPQVTDISSASLPNTPADVVLMQDNSNYYSFISYPNGDIVRLDFGSDLAANTAPAITNLGNFNKLGTNQGLGVAKSQSSYYLFSCNYDLDELYRLRFPLSCEVNTLTSTEEAPSNILFGKEGSYNITLTALDDQQAVSNFSRSIYVRPDIDKSFTVAAQCLGESTRFTGPSSLVHNRIKSWQWHFGDGTTAVGQQVDHPYTAAGTYTVTLEVTTACDKVETIQKAVRIYRQSEPAFNAPANACSNAVIPFRDATRVFDDLVERYEWNFGDGGTSTQRSPDYQYKRAGAYVVTMTVYGVSGCSQSVSKPITINEGATVGFGVSALCYGDDTQFSDLTTFAENVTLVSRVWDFGDNTTSSEPNPVHKYATVGSYTVTLTVHNNLGCASSETKVIQVRRLPTPMFAYSLACTGEITSFTDETLANEGSISAWEWDFGDTASGSSNTSEERNPEHTFGAPGTYEVTLKVFTSFGCWGSITRTVVVTPAPAASFLFEVDCGNRAVIFKDVSSTETGERITDWYWDFGDGASSTLADPVHVYDQPGVYTITLVVTSDTRCRNAYTTIVNVSDPPVAAFALPDTICAGVPVTFTDGSTASPADPIVRWQWQAGTLGSATGRSATFTFPAGSTAVAVTLKVTTAAGCTHTVTQNVNPTPVPTALFDYVTSAATPLNIRFVNSSSADAVSFWWDFGDGQTSLQRDPMHTYATGGTYAVRLRSANAGGCTAESVQTIVVSEVSDLYELKLEHLLATWSGSGTDIRVKLFNKSANAISSLTFAVVADEQRVYSVNWSGNLQPAADLSYSFSLPAGAEMKGFTTLCVQAKDETNGRLSNRQCVSLAGAFTLFNLYPSPATGQVQVSLVVPHEGMVRTEIFDALGRLVAGQAVQEYRQAGYYSRTHDLAGLSKGLYFVKVLFEGQVQIKRLFVH